MAKPTLSDIKARTTGHFIDKEATGALNPVNDDEIKSVVFNEVIQDIPVSNPYIPPVSIQEINRYSYLRCVIQEVPA